MIDLHCHILYGLDDGASNFDESFSLCKSAIENSINAIIATPHFRDYYHIEAFVEIRERRAQRLRDAIEEAGLDLGLGTGCELFLCDDVFAVEDFSSLAIHNTRYVLAEYQLPPFDPKYAVVYAEKIVRDGFVPIIAHPERYRTFLDNPWVVNELLDMGALLQLNASSLAGKGGERVKLFATELVLSGKAQFIGTDAHSPQTRANDYIRCRATFDERITSEMLHRLTCKNPFRVISDQPPKKFFKERNTG